MSIVLSAIENNERFLKAEEFALRHGARCLCCILDSHT